MDSHALYKFTNQILKNSILNLLMMVHTFNPSTQEADGGRSESEVS